MTTETVNGNTVTVADVRKDITDRTNTTTPPFFERIRKWTKTAAKICAGVAVVGFGVLSAAASAGVVLPLYVTITVGILSGIGSLGAAAGVGAAKVAQMTTANKEILARPSNELVKV